MTKELINFFREEYFKVYEDNYPVAWAKDSAIMSRLSKEYPVETLKKYIVEYFKLSDDFIMNAGHKIQLIRTQIPRIQMKLKQERKEIPSKINPDAEAILLAEKNLETKGDF